MGYTTKFDGSISIVPPLNAHEISYLKRFAGSRHVDGEDGPYVTRDTDDPGFSQPPPEQPGLYCDWEPSDDGTVLRWNGSENSYDSPEWVRYLIGTFLRPDAALLAELVTSNLVPDRYYAPEFAHFTFDHVLDGVVNAQGEEVGDLWQLSVIANDVTERRR